MDEIYDLEHGQMYTFPGIKINILRVPGGWTYSWYKRFLFWNITTSAVFVPLDDEFAQTIKENKIGYK